MRNRAQCKHCGDIIESTHRHNMVSCKCFDDSQVAIRQFELDQGYIIKNPKYNPDSIEPGTILEYIDGKPRDKLLWDYIEHNSTGFYLDGGGAYYRYGGNMEHIKWLTDEGESDE